MNEAMRSAIGRIFARQCQMGGHIDIISTFADFVMGHMAPGKLEWAKTHEVFNESSMH